MAISTTISSGKVLTGSAPAAFPSLLYPLVMAAAGMVQRWRGQLQQSIQLNRAWRHRKAAEAKRQAAAARRQQRHTLPPASPARSAAYLQALALENEAMAFDALADGNPETAAEHQAEAAWFAAAACERAAFAAIWPEV